MNQIDFRVWLQEQLNEREWRPTDLARRAELSDAAIGRFLKGERNADPDSLKAIAKAFRLPQVEVFRAAGMLPSNPQIDETTERIIHEIADLTEAEKQEVLAFINMKRNLRSRR